MIVRMNQSGRVVWVFGRRQESADGAEPWEHVNPPLAPVDGRFRQPTDIAWDSQGNSYITDGYVNSRVAKFDRNGDWVMSWGEPGTGPGPVPPAARVVIDRDDNIYVGDRTNQRVQVFNTDGKYLREWKVVVPPDFTTRAVNGPTPKAGDMSGVGAPNSLCITPGPSAGDLSWREHVAGAHLQGVARRKGARRHRQVRPQPEAVLRGARHRVPVRERDLRRRNVELAGAEAAPPFRELRHNRWMTEWLAGLRREHTTGAFADEDAHPDPFEQFRLWLE